MGVSDILTRFVASLGLRTRQKVFFRCLIPFYPINFIEPTFIMLKFADFVLIVETSNWHSAAYKLFYDLTTLSNIVLEHAQSQQHTSMLTEWVWSVNHRHTEQRMQDL